jgi:hypothetical protein
MDKSKENVSIMESIEKAKVKIKELNAQNDEDRTCNYTEHGKRCGKPGSIKVKGICEIFGKMVEIEGWLCEDHFERIPYINNTIKRNEGV